MAITQNNVQNVKFLRNGNIFNPSADQTARKVALAAMNGQLDNLADGTAILGRYQETNGIVKTLVGFAYISGDTKTLTVFDVEGASADVEELRQEINAKLGDGVTSTNTATAQFEALSGTSFSSSGDTSVWGAKKYADQKISDAISSLDYDDSAVTGEYVSQVTEADGVIAVTRVALPDASSVANENKVVTDVTQSKGAITATAANITGVKLAGYAEGTDADIAATDTLGEALGKLQAQINAMDKNADAVAGQVVTTVTEVNGKVTETKANVKDLQLGGYTKDTAATGDIASTDTINAALSKLENKAAAITIANADKSINITTGASGTDINVNIKSGESVLAKDGSAGLYTDIKLSGITPSSTTVKEEYALVGTDGSQLGTSIKVYKDSSIVSITYITDPADTHYQNLEYVYIDASGNTQTEYVDISSLVLEAEFASGITVTNHVAHGVVDSTSETFLTVGADGFKLDGVQDAIDSAINALDATGGTQTIATDKHVAVEVIEADGKITTVTVVEDNIADADDLATEITNRTGADTELSNRLGANVTTANTASAQLSALSGTSADESGVTSVYGAKAYAKDYTDEKVAAVVDGLDADVSGNSTHVTVGVEEVNGKITAVTVSESNIANADDLTAEIAARKAVDGQSGQTYAANTNANYISNATSLNDADVKLDAALKAADDAMLTGVAAGNGITVSDKNSKSQTISAKVYNDGGIVNDATGLHLGTIDCGTY